MKRKIVYYYTNLVLVFCMAVAVPSHAQGNRSESGDFAVKGFHLDLRVQVMKMPALRQFAKKLSEHGVNTLVMEWEATYPYQKHTVISNKYAYSRVEVTAFVGYCDSLGIDVIPLQQSFGHVEYILQHPRYKALREDSKDFSQVNPTEEELCRALFADLYSDMINTHTSRYIHIGGDETYLLGHSAASRAKADSLGMGRLYGDYIKLLCDLVISLGKTPVVWADIALKYPEALAGLPKETVFVDWNYGWELDRFGDHTKLLESGFEIWGSPAIRSYPDNYYLTDWHNHFDNLEHFIPEMRRLGYKGVVMTSWSTSGIYSPIWESHGDMNDLHAVRRVYPISGFDMLIAAYFESIAADTPFGSGAFVLKYAEEQYGLQQKDAHIFWQLLKKTPYEVLQGKVVDVGSGVDKELSVAQLADSALYVYEQLKSLPVVKNKAYFAHYLLMAKIRYQHLVCKSVETAMNMPSYRASDAGKLLEALNTLDMHEVDQEFNKLNGHLLQIDELEKENKLRNYRYDKLKAILEQHQALFR